MILTVQALPLLLKFDDRPRVAIYDAARSSLADELRRSRSVQVAEMRSAEEVANSIPEASGPMVGVILPAGWESGKDALTVDGYLAASISSSTATRLLSQAESALSTYTGRPVTIQSQIVYPTMESRGHNIMVASGLVLATVLITAILVPHLILEEKRTHTLDLLRVSPASINQVLMGKGIAGLVYGLLAAALLLAFNLGMVSLWGLMLPAILLIILFGVGVGLLVGALAENEGMLQMWIGVLAILLLIPFMLNFANSSRIPEWIQQVMAWLPTTAAYDLMRLSFGNTIQVAQIWPRLAFLLIAVVIVFGAAGWRLRTLEA